MWPGAVSLCSCSQKVPHSSCTELGGDVPLSMFPLLHSLLRVCPGGRALWACPPNSVLPTGEAFPSLSLSYRSMGEEGLALRARAHPSQTLDLLLPLSHISLPSSLTRPPSPPHPKTGYTTPREGGRANVFVGRRKIYKEMNNT